jgi:hypothetical protein
MKRIYKLCYTLITVFALIGVNKLPIYAYQKEEYQIRDYYRIEPSNPVVYPITPFGIEFGSPCPPRIKKYLKPNPRPVREGEYRADFIINPSSNAYDGECIPKPNKFFNALMLYTTPKDEFIVNGLIVHYRLRNRGGGNWFDRHSQALVSYDEFLKDTAIVLDRLFSKYGAPVSLLDKYQFDELSPDNLYKIIKLSLARSSDMDEDYAKRLSFDWGIKSGYVSFKIDSLESTLVRTLSYRQDFVHDFNELEL